MKTFLIVLIAFVGLTGFKTDKNRQITGTVYSFDDKLPIPGVLVKVVDNVKNTYTDANGKYQITVPDGKTRVVFIAVGYRTDTVTLTNSNIVNIYLKNATFQLNETIVTKSSTTPNGLAGRVAGIKVTSDGSITHQGQQVTKARLNGKDYIGNSANQASQNGLPAMLLDQVVVGYGQQIAKTETRSFGQDKALHEVVINLRGNRDINNNESYSRIVENQFENPITTPLSTFAVDVDAASYSNVRRYINNGQLPPKNAVRIEELVNYFHYDLPQPENGNPVAIQTELAAAPWNPQHQLVRIGLKAKDVKLEKLPPSNLVLLLDVSGSMGEPNKLVLVKPAMKMLIDQLRAIDHVAIVVYAGDAGVKLPSTPGNEKQKIKDAIDQLNAGGSTAGGEGIKMAYQIATQNFIKGGNNRIILATDGDFNVGPSSDKDMEQLIEDERGSGVSISILGFGMGNLKDSKMERMADKGHGNYAYIDNITEATKSMVSEFGGTLFTVAKDVKLQVEFNPGKVQAYRLLGYEDRLMVKEDFNNDTKVAGDMGVGHTVTALYEIIPVGVKDNFTNSVDPLKYQKPVETKVANTSTEIMTVKFRYKDPESEVSKLEAVTVNDKPEIKTSDDFRFAAAVAEYGMLLRDSRFKQNSQFDQLITMAKSAKGKDDDGYRAEFIRLAESTKNLMKSNEVVAAN
ncbi:MAG: YfbK domain-containing protein [Mucilaginibacter sp.]